MLLGCGPSGGGSSLGYLAAHAAAQIDSRIATANPATDKAMFSALDHSTPTYTRSTTCWADDIDLTCVSPWNSDGLADKAGAAISPLHVLFSTHSVPAVSSTIRFVTLDNTLITRTITATASIPTTRTLYPDLSVALLDSPLPSTIKIAKVLPTNWKQYLPLQVAPVLVVDLEKKALVSDMWELDLHSDSYIARFATPTDATRLDFNETYISGDSGSPSFLIINGEAVILSTLTSGGEGSGSSVSGLRDAVNGLMTTLGGGYQLTPFDLSVCTPVSAPSPAPTLTLDEIGDSYIQVSWTGGLNGNIYVDGVLDVVNLNRTSPAVVVLTNFVEVDVTVKSALGHLESAASNVVTTYPTYGPITVPLVSVSPLITLPDGSWTVSTLFWGASRSPADISFSNEDVSIFYFWDGSQWIDGISSLPAPDAVVNFDFIVYNDNAAAFTFWSGQVP